MAANGWGSGAEPHHKLQRWTRMRVVRFVASRFEELVAGTFLVLMSLATFVNVILRYFFNSPIEWAEEFSRYAFIWLVFMGAALATKYKKHIVIDTMLIVLHGRARAAMTLLADLVSLAVMLVLVYFGWILMTYATQPTATLKIPQYLVYMVVPLSAALIIIHSLGDIRRSLLSLVRGGELP